MINLVTMAGKGKRFADEGYTLPKPLIPVDGVPMVHRVIDSLPKAEKWVFVVRQEHIDEYQIDKVIRQKVPQAIIEADTDLIGGASIFCVEGHLDPNEDVLIAGCDNGYVFDEKKFAAAKKTGADCVLWSFTQDDRLSASPKSWGYVVLSKDNLTITDMSVKIPISDNPFNDHGVTATFWLSSVKTLYDAIRLMVKEEIKVNNEFYLDMLPVVLKKMKKKSVIFDVDLYVGWGTPRELHLFEKINFFADFGALKNAPELAPHALKAWERYFDEIHQQ